MVVNPTPVFDLSRDQSVIAKLTCRVTPEGILGSQGTYFEKRPTPEKPTSAGAKRDHILLEHGNEIIETDIEFLEIKALYLFGNAK